MRKDRYMRDYDTFMRHGLEVERYKRDAKEDFKWFAIVCLVSTVFAVVLHTVILVVF